MSKSMSNIKKYIEISELYVKEENLEKQDNYFDQLDVLWWNMCKAEHEIANELINQKKYIWYGGEKNLKTKIK
jgi:hypothetical protein